MHALRSLALAAVSAAVGCAEPGPEPAPPTAAADKSLAPLGQRGDHHVIYVPAYAHVEFGHRQVRRIELTTTLSVHNISFRDSIWIDKVRYYDTAGRLVYDFLDERIPLQPMQTYKVRIARDDTSGGASFLVEWEGADGVPAPIAEAIHVAVSSTAGLSFVTRGTQLAPAVVPDQFTRP